MPNGGSIGDVVADDALCLGEKHLFSRAKKVLHFALPPTAMGGRHAAREGERKPVVLELNKCIRSNFYEVSFFHSLSSSLLLSEK